MFIPILFPTYTLHAAFFAPFDNEEVAFPPEGVAIATDPSERDVAEVVENLELFDVLANFLYICRVSSFVRGHMGGVQDVFAYRLSPLNMDTFGGETPPHVPCSNPDIE